MEGLLTLGGLLLLVIVIGVPYLLVSHARLKTRVGTLERDLRDLRLRLDETAPADAESTASPWTRDRAGEAPPPELAAETAPGRLVEAPPPIPPAPLPEPHQPPR